MHCFWHGFLVVGVLSVVVDMDDLFRSKYVIDGRLLFGSNDRQRACMSMGRFFVLWFPPFLDDICYFSGSYPACRRFHD